MTERLTGAQIQKEVGALSGWELKAGTITKCYTFGDFKEAIAFVNRVARMAEEADHHPDLLIQYRKVQLTLSTHSAGGLTGKDFALARRIDAS